MNESSSFPVGTKVRVKDYPPATMQAAPFNWNGLVGTVVRLEKVGLTWDNRPAYAYDVYFENVEVPYVRRNRETGKLERGKEVSNARNYFEETFLERAS